MMPHEVMGLSHADALSEGLRLHGHKEVPTPSCMHLECSLGAASALIEFEFEPAENGGRDSPSWEASLTVTGAFINGAWVGTDQFAADVTDAWHKAAVKHLREMIRDRECA